MHEVIELQRLQRGLQGFRSFTEEREHDRDGEGVTITRASNRCIPTELTDFSTSREICTSRFVSESREPISLPGTNMNMQPSNSH